MVPFTPATINVVGAVYNLSSFLYQHGGTVGRYLQLAGGPNRKAYRNRSFVIRTDGSVDSHEAVNSYWGHAFNQLRG